MGRSFDPLDHSQFPARLFRHALWGPDRLVDDVDAGVGDSRQREQVVADVRHHVCCHRTAQRRQGHLHIDALGLDRDVVDEPKVDDVDRDLRVEALAEDFDHVLGFDRRVRRDLSSDRCLLAHGLFISFSSGRPASRQALVPPRKLTTSFTASATAISEATADRSPDWQTNTVLSSNFWAAGLARIELSTTCRAPGMWPLFHSQSSRTSTRLYPSSISFLTSSSCASRKDVSCSLIPIYYSSSSSANP